MQDQREETDSKLEALRRDMERDNSALVDQVAALEDIIHRNSEIHMKMVADMEARSVAAHADLRNLIITALGNKANGVAVPSASDSNVPLPFPDQDTEVDPPVYGKQRSAAVAVGVTNITPYGC